jgi:2-hydroxycyclohexanecarboxyl-CoA dehydrogenase
VTGRVAVVTGGASGIGLGCARHLVKAGHRLALFDLGEDRVAEAAAGIGATGHVVDVTDPAAITAAVAAVRAELGPVEIIVTSAGIDAMGDFATLSLEDWNRGIAVNLTGTFLCIQAVIADMVTAQWGRIVTISSSSAQMGAPGRPQYVASKGGVIALTKALSQDYSRMGITSNTIPPSIIDTPMMRASEAAGLTPVEMVTQMTPVGRLGTPDDVGAMAAFLCSDDGGFITGQQIGVNGGWYV